MIYLFLALLLLISFIVFLNASKSNKSNSVNSEDLFPYEKISVLYSPAERSLLGVIDLAVGQNYRVFGKVRVDDVASVKKMHNRKN